MSDLEKAAGLLRSRRDAIGAKLAALVSGWGKYAAPYAADPAGFAQTETHALVDYIALLIETGDENFRHLYIGEKAKQFHDLSIDAEEKRAREAVLLAGEREIFTAELNALPAARRAIDAAFDVIEHALTAEAVAEVKALFVGDCLYLDVISFLTAPALTDGVRLRPRFITSHDAVEIKSQIGKLADERFDVIFYSPFTYAMLSDYAALQRPRALASPGKMAGDVRSAVAAALDIFDLLADLFDCPIVAHAPAPILREESGLVQRLGAIGTRSFRKRACTQLGTALRTRAAQRNDKGQVVHILDEAEMAGPAGIVAAGRYLARFDLQHPAMFGAMIAPFYRDIVMVVGRLLKRKLIACDLDNTLWHGVIGEGLGVTQHYDRQAPLLRLKARGVVLAINSKNDPAKAVWEAEAGRLSLDDFVSRQINWDPKPMNMRRIAQHLNLKEKDFVFIDDRADERAMVEEQLPATLALDALDPRSWRLFDLWADLLPAKPGADRTEFYRQRDARQAFIAVEAETGEQERRAMFSQLGLTLKIREAGAGDLDRVADLINRTNQFNMTGARVTKRQVEELAAREDAWVLIADASDRFGSMGTISVLIAERDKGRLTVPIYVLSCRVFGYGMEFAILEEARKLAVPGQAMFGPLAETPFNQPCREVYPDAGFVPAEGGWLRENAERAPIAVESWLMIDSTIPAPDAARRHAPV
ncbi:HAD-IIIC family phosphatase [Sphingomonas sp. AP4-R1]|uniref:HAD-IIIC family phosphatase n=1 Tax=Sphingomonas sp. AP4-R1 TaxID=2735134 RepID=UPI00149333A7|nr:HAD-IIIC family phosphatase [Sphingomonas sp. AP4-R1]QJU59808.1 HAD-IIIC family phosphatase [Sphingomonas sp. AP4-R1]